MVANEYLMKWYLFKDALMLNRSDGALVRITALVKPGEEEQVADDRIKQFIVAVSPLLPGYLPN
nr:exosortase-associated EpsI family protein [Methylocucumis oryzae]